MSQLLKAGLFAAAALAVAAAAACVLALEAAGAAVIGANTDAIEAADFTPPMLVELRGEEQVEEQGYASFWATFSDDGQGGSGIAEIRMTLDGVHLETYVESGEYGQDTVELQGFAQDITGVGEQQVCATATDGAGNTSPSHCMTVTVLRGEGPATRDVTVSPDPVPLDTPVRVMATIDDTESGNSFVGGGHLVVDGSRSVDVQSSDFDMPVEDVWAELPGFDDAGVYTICVIGHDIWGNESVDFFDCAQLTVVDDQAPEVRYLTLPDEVAEGAAVPLRAFVSDKDHGDSIIDSVTAVIDGDQTITLLAPGAGSSETQFIEEDLPGLEVGAREVCVTATDVAGNTSRATCRTVTAYETTPPVARALSVSDDAVVGEPVQFTAVLDDQSTGGSDISAGVLVHVDEDGAASRMFRPVDGRFDSPLEAVTAETRFQRAGEHTLCAVARDVHSHSEPMSCITVSVAPRSAVGEGTIASNLQPLASEATFAFELTQRPDGAGEGTLSYTDGPMQFTATSIDAFDVSESVRASMWGEGLRNGVEPCSFVAHAVEPGHDGYAHGGFGIRLSCVSSLDDQLDYTTLPRRPLLSGSVTARGAH